MSDEAVDAEFVSESTALAVRQEAAPAPVGIWNTDDPVEVIGKATRVADALKAVVVSKGLISNIQGKQYPQVEAWTTLASMLGVAVVTEWTRRVEGGWEARVVAQRNGLTIGAAEAQCTREEKSWKTRDDYALRSMAQTRATSKALRLPLGFVMTLAGYNPTPAEEIPVDDSRATSEPRRADTPADKHKRGVAALAILCKERGVSDTARHTLSLELFGKESTKDLTIEQLRALYAEIKERTNPDAAA